MGKKRKPTEFLGKAFHLLKVFDIRFELTENKKRRRWYIYSECACGNVVRSTTSCLTLGKTKSCGCYKRSLATKHGMCKSKEYFIWSAMHDRCYLKTSQQFKNYGARGIEVDVRWHKFENFYADMGPKPSGLSLDRINNSANYGPENCRWSNQKTQMRNTRNARKIFYKGKLRALAEVAEKAGMSRQVLLSRIEHLGWSTKRAVETPVKKYKTKA